MIVFNNWQISSTGVLAQQYDNLTRRVEVVGELPDGYEWSLLVECDGNKDTLHLERSEQGVGVTLTQDNLCFAGYYRLQLRGNLTEDTSKTRHTNVVQTYVPVSLTGTGQWPEMPSEFAQIEQRLLELNAHPPIPGENGYWMLWNPDTNQYEESEFEATAETAALRAEAAEKSAASHKTAAAKSAEDAAEAATAAAQDKAAAANERQAAEDAARSSADSARAAGESGTGAAGSAAAAKKSAEDAEASRAAADKSAQGAGSSAKGAKVSEEAAARSETNAKASEEAAKQSEERTRQNEAELQDAVNSAALSAHRAASSAGAADASARAAKSSENGAAADAQSAKTSATNAAESASGAKAAEQGAKAAEASAKNYSKQAQAVAGNIPYAGGNGNWFIGGKDSGVPATGDNGFSIYYSRTTTMNGNVGDRQGIDPEYVQTYGKELQKGDIIVNVRKNGDIAFYVVVTNKLTDGSWIGECLAIVANNYSIYFCTETTSREIGVFTTFPADTIRLGNAPLKKGDLIITADAHLALVAGTGGTNSSGTQVVTCEILSCWSDNVLTAPDGTRYQLAVDNDGNLTTTKLS